MYRFETIYDAVSAKERRTLSALFSHQLMGEIALEWAELIRSSVKKDHELILFKIFREEKLIGIAILSIIRKLKILQWTAAPSLFKAFINFDVGFIEIPLSNMSGLLTEQGLDIGERYRIMDVLCGHIRQKININILCIKINQDPDVASKSILCKNMTPLSFSPNTVLKYPYGSFREYADSLPRKKYRRCIADQKKLKKEGGDIEIVQDISNCIDEIYALYKKTCNQAKKKKDYMEMPVLIDKDFFTIIQTFSNLKPRFITIRVNGDIIAYSLLLQSGRTLFFKAVGLDYNLSYPTKSYFNLFYAALEYAGQQQCNKIDFGMTSYHFKQWLGCELTPASYICCSFTPLISLFKKPLAFFIGHKIRSGGSK